MASQTDITCAGHCTACGHEHSLTAGPALEACHRLMELLDEKRRIDLHVPDDQADPRLSTNVLFSEARGHMFGVMVYADAKGNRGEARAFSGQYDSVWLVDGWVPPVLSLARFERINTPGERMIKALGREMEALPPGSSERLALKRKRRAMSQELMEKIFRLYRLKNLAGQTAPLVEVFQGSGIPTGTGDCCAPKLLQYAAVNNLTPLGLAEFYWGRENRSGSKRHGRFYPACQEKCRPILGFMLHGLVC